MFVSVFFMNLIVSTLGKSILEIKKSLQFHALVTSFMLLATYTCVFMGAEIFILATNSLDPATKAKIQPYGTTIQICSSSCSFGICVTRSQEIREAISKTFDSKTLASKISKILNKTSVTILVHR